MNVIRILDVIAKPYAEWSTTICYYLIVDRMPARIYSRGPGERLTSSDSGFYDFLQIENGSQGAFGGCEFDLTLDDGTTYRAHGQVWSVAPDKDREPVVQVGIATLDMLRKHYVFTGSHVSREKLLAWLDANTPSTDYYKYDERSTIEWLEQRRNGGARKICANRARKLRHRGVQVWRNEAGDRLWSPWFERKRREIAERRANDPGSVHFEGAA